jgi:hypothetical protein
MTGEEMVRTTSIAALCGLMLAMALGACAQNAAPPPAQAAAPEAAPTFDPACMNDEDKRSLATPNPFPSDEDCACIFADRRLMPIQSKLLLNPANVDPILMVVADPPYKSDRRALALNAQYRKQCHALRLAALRQSNAALAPVYADRYAQYEGVYDALAESGTALTYGEANQRLRKVYLQSEARRTGKPAPQ